MTHRLTLFALAFLLVVLRQTSPLQVPSLRPLDSTEEFDLSEPEVDDSINRNAKSTARIPSAIPGRRSPRIASESEQSIESDSPVNSGRGDENDQPRRRYNLRDRQHDRHPGNCDRFAVWNQ